MNKIIFNDNKRVVKFVNKFQPINGGPDVQGIGLEKDGELIAGVLYDDYNGSNVWMHVAAVAGKRWLVREYLYICFRYPFQQLDLNRVTGWVEETNKDAVRFNEHLGFKKEAVLRKAGRYGQDVFLYVMHKQDCKWIKAKSHEILSVN